MDELKKLIDGFYRFQGKYFGQENSLFDQLKRGQSPTSLVIGCSDSRVDPALLTDCNPGDMFVVRNVANLVPPYEKDGTYHGVSSAIEFAVCDLQVKRIIVLGHSSCGGIGALLKGYNPKTEANFVGRWVRMAESARQYVLDNYGDKPLHEQVRACEMAAIVVSLDNLMSFPFIADAVAQGKLFLVGWYFDIEQGELHQYDAASGNFRSLVAPLAE
ncbi:carbonic anhydrase [Silvimonas iriomotensis]|uniref:Carbonic anhydrase n=1 Tax=Silvimonas iriomotensis TaxID=449662 RepID=A0ABQ2P8M7_9NEIS|nr:carbonic anhydrase [Silvimonas iriomotensis]GGP20598.1 carbonic anhydrase [Silvimonas iriomotensis]